MKTFGNRLRALREAQEWSQEELGFELEVSKATISKWENGKAYPIMERLLKIKNLFGSDSVSLDSLVSERINRREATYAGAQRVAESPAVYEVDGRMARSQAEIQLLRGFRTLPRKRQKALIKLLAEDG